MTLTTVELIKGCGIRKATLARLIGVSKSALTMYGSGDRTPSNETADKLASITQHQLTLVKGQIRFVPLRRRGRKIVS